MELFVSIEREVGEIKVMAENIEKLLKAQNGRIGKLEDEVGALRRWQMLVIGIFTAAGGGLGTLLSKFLH